MSAASVRKSKIVPAALVATCVAAADASAAPVRYDIDPSHTYPSIEIDHLGGLSRWRGKINRSAGTIILDTQAQTGSVHVTMDLTTIDFGHDAMNEQALTKDFLDVATYPTAVYAGKLTAFEDGKPTQVEGTLSLRGVTQPVTVSIHSFLCKKHPLTKKEICGADASAELDREDFGIFYGASSGTLTDVKLQIQVEAIRAE